MEYFTNSALWKAIGGENQVFAGGFGLAILAAGAQTVKAGSRLGLTLLKRHFLITMEITSKDRAYPWVCVYYLDHCSGCIVQFWSFAPFRF